MGADFLYPWRRHTCLIQKFKEIHKSTHNWKIGVFGGRKWEELLSRVQRWRVKGDDQLIRYVCKIIRNIQLVKYSLWHGQEGHKSRSASQIGRDV